MVTQDDLLREHISTYRSFIRSSVYAGIGVIAGLVLLAIITL